METHKTIERFGGLIKEEALNCIQDDILLPNTCVLEAASPYFGYYSQEPSAQKPQHLYLTLNGYYSFESIMRSTQNIKKHFNHSFDAAPGSISVFGNICQAIRIKNLQQYSHVSSLQRLYMEEGIMFKKKSIKIHNEMAMIKLRKFFNLEYQSDNIYIDKDEPHHAYFVLPEQIDWESLKRVTKQVKMDTCCFYFDAALAFIYNEKEIKDLIRIYSINFKLDDVKDIQGKYYKYLGY